MQAIRTKYTGPTNTRPSRIIASCDAGKLTVSYDHGLNLDDNHKAAAQKLAAKLQWIGQDYPTAKVYGGHLPDGSMCWVFAASWLSFN